MGTLGLPTTVHQPDTTHLLRNAVDDGSGHLQTLNVGARGDEGARQLRHQHFRFVAKGIQLGDFIFCAIEILMVEIVASVNKNKHFAEKFAKKAHENGSDAINTTWVVAAQFREERGDEDFVFLVLITVSP